MRPALLALAILVAASLTADAQGEQVEACRAPVLQLQTPPQEFDAGASDNLLFSIENPNGPPVQTVRATLTTTTPAGWSASVAQRELTMGPRNVTVDVLSITAPPRGAGESHGNITLHVTFVCASGDVQTSASASIVLGVAVRGFEAPWPVVLTGFLLLLLGVTLLGIRRLRRGVAISCRSSERLVAPGKSAKFEVVVLNRRGKPQRLRFLATGVPEGWQTHLALDAVELEPGEEKQLWVLVKAPPEAQPGEEAAVALRLEDAGREVAACAVRARVSAPQA